MDILEHNLDSSGECDGEVVGLVDSKDVLTQEQLTIVEDGSSLGSEEGHVVGGHVHGHGHGHGSVAHLAATQHLLEDVRDGDGVGDDVQYAFRTVSGDNTTVTYRVVQVDDPLSQIVTTSNFGGAGAHGHGHHQVVTTPINGHLYVLGNSSEVFTTTTTAAAAQQRNIAPRSIPHLNSNSNTKKRDDRRRATHNEVERRRRDKINNWIIKLSKIIPDMSSSATATAAAAADITKGNGTFEGQSKGGILAKACDYIMELRQRNQHLQEVLKEQQQQSNNDQHHQVQVVQVEASSAAASNDVIKQLKTENDLLKKENLMLRQQLQINGICVPPDAVDLNDPLS